jgi:hypothetical protein
MAAENEEAVQPLSRHDGGDLPPIAQHAFLTTKTVAEIKQTADVDRDRLVRRGRAYRIRPPHGYAIDREFFEPFDPVDYGFSHAAAGIRRLPHQPERVLE